MWMNRFLAVFTVALLGACGGDSGALGDSPTVSGQVTLPGRNASGWTMQARVGNAMATAPIDAAGRFSIQLPGGDALTGALGSSSFSIGCNMNQVSVSPSTVRSVTASFAIIANNQPFQQPTPVTIGAKSGAFDTLSVAYVFFDHDASASGTVNCLGGDFPSTVDVNVRKGWNVLLSLEVAFGHLETSGPLPSAAQWKAGM